MANLLPKTLAFRHTFVSSVVKENTVTLFGEVGSEFELGTDYDAEILYKVSSSELSNLVKESSNVVSFLISALTL
jgi:hypothetical protein